MTGPDHNNLWAHTGPDTTDLLKKMDKQKVLLPCHYAMRIQMPIVCSSKRQGPGSSVVSTFMFPIITLATPFRPLVTWEGTHLQIL